MRRIRVPLFLAMACLLAACDAGDEGNGGGGVGGSPLQIITITLATGDVGVAYSSPILTSGGSGSGYVWSVISGALPAGLSLVQTSPNSALSGTPTTNGTFSFVVEVADPAGGSGAQAYTLVINTAATLTITTSNLPGGPTGVFYQQPIKATGGSGTYGWTVVSGALPPGLAVVAGTPSASLEGTPTMQGTYMFTVEVMDLMASVDTESLTVIIALAGTLTITTASLTNGAVASSYSQTVSASGGVQPYTWRVSAGVLGYGLALTSGTPDATVGGIPHFATTLTFTLEVEDSLGVTAQAGFSITIQPSALSIPAVTLDYAVQTFRYQFSVPCLGGTGGGTWSIVAGSLPSGVSLTGANRHCVISGIPTVNGTFAFTIEIMDALGTTASRAFSLDVRAAFGALVIANQRFGPYVVGSGAYPSEYMLNAAGGTGTGYAWAFAAGSQVPPGMVISTTSPYYLTGTLTLAGTYTFTLEVADAALNVATRSFTVVVEPGTDLFGIPVRQSVVILLDVSGNMAGSGIAMARAEINGMLANLPATVDFDLAAFAGHFPASSDHTQFLWGGLRPATAANVSAAITWVNGSSTNPGWGGTPTYECVQRACQIYPATLESIVLIQAGVPSGIYPPSYVLADFPSWFAFFNDCRFNTVSIGTQAIDFLQLLAALGKGSFVAS